jgi:hypothetical protein
MAAEPPVRIKPLKRITSRERFMRAQAHGLGK